ncbi:MAG: hypothetical protein Q8Q94_01105 [bacterium]|nr:hypothetical protein [bacterium]MDZ4299677.1 hypothetical protein [Candidatus Sungbacteria bacterium]
MTLTTHAAIAVALTKPFMHAHPIIIFCIAIASHYLSDAVPHWDYPLSSISAAKNAEGRRWHFHSTHFLKDARNMACDGILGLTLVLALAHPTTVREFSWVLLAVIGGALPDFLQGVYYTRRAELLRPVQHFHDTMHTNIRLGAYPFIGIPFQGAILVLALWLVG